MALAQRPRRAPRLRADGPVFFCGRRLCGRRCAVARRRTPARRPDRETEHHLAVAQGRESTSTSRGRIDVRDCIRRRPRHPRNGEPRLLCITRAVKRAITSDGNPIGISKPVFGSTMEIAAETVDAGFQIALPDTFRTPRWRPARRLRGRLGETAAVVMDGLALRATNAGQSGARRRRAPLREPALRGPHES